LLDLIDAQPDKIVFGKELARFPGSIETVLRAEDVTLSDLDTLATTQTKIHIVVARNSPNYARLHRFGGLIGVLFAGSAPTI